MKKISTYIIKQLSKFIYLLIPEEFKQNSSSIKVKAYLEYEKKQIEDSFNHFEKYLIKSIHFENERDIRKYAIEKSLLNDNEKNKTYIEFGVFEGRSINFFSNYVKTIYGFDSFKGLRENWLGTKVLRKEFSINKETKILNTNLNSNVIAVTGWVQDTLKDFLSKNKPTINFVHMDFDTYESTKYVLENIKPYLDKNAIILFDEFHNTIGWKNGEYKALKETFDENEYTYKGFCVYGAQAVIQLN